MSLNWYTLRLGDRLRVAGTAEFNGFNLELNLVRCLRLRGGWEVFGDAVDLTQPNYWQGCDRWHRQNVPIIGRAVNRHGRIDNLYLNTDMAIWAGRTRTAPAKRWLISCKRASATSNFNFVGLQD